MRAPAEPLDQIPWMPSPPLAPDDRLIDTDHLEEVTFGDHALRREILALFVRQSQTLMRQLAGLPPEAAALAHTLKGSARGIGALSVADCAERLEQAADHRACSAALAELKAAMSETIGLIETLLRAP